mgnify:CR=1 FL=1
MAMYLVTGGAGFIGSHIVEELLRNGETVRVLDNFSTGTHNNISEYINQIELVEGDICDINTVRYAMQGVDYVLHQAALPSVPRSITDPFTSHEVNATGTLNVLIAARDVSVKRVVCASSSSIYGNSPTLPKVEDMPSNPLSPYAVSKLSAEGYCRVFFQVFGTPTVALRYFNVFGPRQDPTSQYSAVIPRFIIAMLRDEAPIIYGDGLQSRDFTYVTNVVRANLLACKKESAAGQVFNIALGRRISLMELMATLNIVLGSDIKPQFQAPRKGDVVHSQADVSKMQQVIGLDKIVELEEGLQLTVEWYADHICRL